MTNTLDRLSDIVPPAPTACQSAPDRSAPVSEPVSETVFDARRIEKVFNTVFASYNTRLTGGAQEPLYQPAAVDGQNHTLYYREDFFASALHETAHWCIAGDARRQHVDFGYWYAPDGRDAAAQQAFEAVEVKPQALEWFFSLACGYPFRVSVDNLSQAEGCLPKADNFERRVSVQAEQWQRSGLPHRAQIFFQALSDSFATGKTVGACDFSLSTASNDT